MGGLRYRWNFYGGIVLAGMFPTCLPSTKVEKEYPFFIGLGLVLAHARRTLGLHRCARLWSGYSYLGCPAACSTVDNVFVGLFRLSLFEVLSFFFRQKTHTGGHNFCSFCSFILYSWRSVRCCRDQPNFGLMAISGSWLIVFMHSLSDRG